MFTSPYPDVEIPEATLYDYVFGGLGAFPRDLLNGARFPRSSCTPTLGPAWRAGRADCRTSPFGATAGARRPRR